MQAKNYGCVLVYFIFGCSYNKTLAEPDDVIRDCRLYKHFLGSKFLSYNIRIECCGTVDHSEMV